MKIICSNKLYVYNPTHELNEFCKDNLVFQNPEYIKLEAMGKWTGKTQRNLVLYERDGDMVVLPFGCLKTVWKQFKNEFSEVKTRFRPKDTIDYDSRITPYPYQKRVIESAVKKKNGIIVMPCGSGKTQTALEIVARLGGKTLWLTHTQDLLTQSMNRAKACFGLKESDYGTITNGKVNIGNAITFATVQTMCNIELQNYRYTWDVIIVDECHKCVGTPTNVMMFYKVLSGLASRYKFGLTATPKRADGLEQCMFALIGDKIDEVTREEVADTTCEVRVEKRLTGYRPNEDVITASDGTIVYSSLVDDLINNEERNQKIVEDLRRIDGNKTCLVLTDRLSHIDTLQKMLNAGNLAKSITGNTNTKSAKAERKMALNRLNNKEIKYLFATYKLAKEGLDIPSLDYLVMATPQKDYTTVVQSAGRVGRRAEGKEYGTIIDYVDDFGMLYGYSRKRNTVYKKMGYKLVDIY